MSITFVTSFYDIGRQTEAPLQKFSNYFGWIESLLKIPINLYFFTTPDLKSQFKYQERDNLKWNLSTPLPYWDRLDEIKTAWQSYQTGNASKDTAEFGALTHGKFIFLDQAMREDPFGDTHYMWIDAGLLKIATNPELLVSLQPSSKIKCLIMSYIGEEVLKFDFIKTCQYKVAAGLFGGPKGLMRAFCYRIMAECEQFLSENRFGLEQETMAMLYYRHPEMFDPYYGSFSDLIINYETLERNEAICYNVFQGALKVSNLAWAVQIAKYAIKSPRLNSGFKNFYSQFLSTQI